MTDFEPSDEDFFSTYGPWTPRRPADVAELLRGYGGLWWIAGGWAIEAFTGQHRHHEDIDPSILRKDLDRFRAHVHGRYDVWGAGAGAMRPMFADDPTSGENLLPEGGGQVWLRPSWNEGWEYDVLLAPGDESTWVYRRDPAVTLPMADALIERDGVRYLAPQIQLLYKSRALRPKDQADFDACLPLIGTDHRTWLADALARADTRHPWITRLR